MFYNVLYKLYASNISFFNIFKYVTIRSICSFLFAFFIVLFVSPKAIRLLKSFQKNGQPIRNDGPESHKESKKGTPTMGGIIILFSMLLSSTLWCDLANIKVISCIVVMIGFGIIGAVDDYFKIANDHSKGLPGKRKFILQSIVAIASYYCCCLSDSTIVYFPIFKNFQIDLGYFFVLWTILVTVGSSNAVNLTDGLDGLAIGPVFTSSIFMAIICYLAGNSIFASYLHMQHVTGLSEVCVLLSSLVGASLGFLWYNAPPAKVFMGDTGSIAIGGLLGFVAVISKHELIYAIVGGVFVIETASVILQVLYFKITKGKRIFLMAPIHHHFEKKGWKEPTIVFRFWIISIVLVIICFALLKIR